MTQDMDMCILALILKGGSVKVFWAVVTGDNFGSTSLSVSVSHQDEAFHRISTLPTSHNKYTEWLDKIEI
eukprot:scaffold9458_cov76-Cyclotella_meneghiniana.AAC.1